MVEKIMATMKDIHYGYLDKDGKNIVEKNPDNWDIEFEEIYHLLSPEELLDKKYGVCYDQVELERKLFQDVGITATSYFIYSAFLESAFTHTFLTYELENTYYWVEHSWNTYSGIHSYSSKKELLLDVKEKFRKSHSLEEDSIIFIYEYEKPTIGINGHEFFDYCCKGTLVKLNEPLYFYHVVDKDADLSLGLLSLQYMYDHKMWNLFDTSSKKYRKGIVSYWNLEKYLGRKKDSLTREEILEALNLFRGEYCSRYIYFFKFPPTSSLGEKMKAMLKEKNIYRINIQDEEVQLQILDIFYGYENNHGDGRRLNLAYYKDVIPEEYFQNYQDSDERNFANLNHIAIAFLEGYCPISFLEKVSSK